MTQLDIPTLLTMEVDLGTSAKILVVTSNPCRNFSKFLSNPRLEFWASEELGLKTTVPSGVELVIRTRFITHDESAQLSEICQRSNVLVFPGLLNTGQVKREINRLLARQRQRIERDPVSNPVKIQEMVLTIIRQNLILENAQEDECRRINAIVRRSGVPYRFDQFKDLFAQVWTREMRRRVQSSARTEVLCGGSLLPLELPELQPEVTAEIPVRVTMTELPEAPVLPAQPECLVEAFGRGAPVVTLPPRSAVDEALMLLDAEAFQHEAEVARHAKLAQALRTIISQFAKG